MRSAPGGKGGRSNARGYPIRSQTDPENSKTSTASNPKGPALRARKDKPKNAKELLNAGGETVCCTARGVASELGVPRERARLAVEQLGLEGASGMEGSRASRKNIAGRL